MDGIAIAIAVVFVAADARGQHPPDVLFHGGDAPVDVGAAPDGLSDTASESCAECHAEIAREWRTSLHRASWSDPVFQAAYAIESQAFCRNCHAPLIARGDERPGRLAAREGVSCSVCHVRAGTVLGEGANRGDVAGGRAPHATMAVRAFASSAYCAPCHQFNFPNNSRLRAGGAAFATDEPMQDTFDEWSRSVSSETHAECQTCHMPWRTGSDGRRYRSHAFAGGRDRELLARAVSVAMTVRRDGADLVASALVAGTGSGHSFPTGDLFRRGELVAWVDGDVRSTQREAFAREFGDALEPDAHGALRFVRREIADSRIPPPGSGAPRRIEFRFAAPPGARVRWAFDHLLMPTPQAAAAGIGEVRNRIRVLEGVATDTVPTGGNR